MDLFIYHLAKPGKEGNQFFSLPCACDNHKYIGKKTTKGRSKDADLASQGILLGGDSWVSVFSTLSTEGKMFPLLSNRLTVHSEVHVWRQRDDS